MPLSERNDIKNTQAAREGGIEISQRKRWWEITYKAQRRIPMIIRNGHEIDKRFLMRLNLQQFAEGDGGTGGDGETGNGDGGNAGDNGAGAGGNDPSGSNGGEDTQALLAQIEQLKADMAKQKAALDKATHEAGEANKALKASKAELQAKMTQEEIDAANKKEAEEKAAERLAELEREVARAKSTKSVMAKLNVDEDTAGKIAESMVGCENVDNALLLIQKVWEAKVKALKQEYGKVPPPGAGGGSEDKEMQAALELAKELGQRKASTAKSVRDQLGGLVR